MLTNSSIPLHRARVLAVDDHAVNQQFLHATLSEAVGLLKLAGSGNEAVECARCNQFDLVLMDLHLPDMNGIEAWLQIRQEQDSNATRVLALTADTREQQRQRLQRAGFHGLLGKPIEPGALIAAMQKALGGDDDFVMAAGTSQFSTLLIDRQKAERASGSLDGARSIQRALARELEQTWPQLDGELARGRFSAAAERLHQWRGACGYAGAGLLDQACREMEDALAGDPKHAAGPAYLELRRVLDATCQAIRLEAEDSA